MERCFIPLHVSDVRLTDTHVQIDFVPKMAPSDEGHAFKIALVRIRCMRLKDCPDAFIRVSTRAPCLRDNECKGPAIPEHGPLSLALLRRFGTPSSTKIRVMAIEMRSGQIVSLIPHATSVSELGRE